MLTPEISIPIYAQFPSGVLIFTIGLYSWLKIRKKENFIFFLLAITQTVFAYGSVALFYSCGNDNLTTFIDRRILYPFCIMMPILVYHFSLEFCQIKTRWQKAMLIGGYLISFGMVVWSQFESFVSGVYHYRWGCHTQSQMGNNFYVLQIAFFVILSIYNLYQVWRNKQNDSLKRGQAVYITIGFLIFSLAGFILLWSYGIGIYPWAYLTLPFFVMIIAYAITRYRLMDIKIIFRDYTVHLITSFFFLAIIYATVLLAAWYTKINVYWGIVGAGFLAAIILLPFFESTRKYLNRLISRYFFSELVDYQAVTNNLIKILSHETNLIKVLGLVNKTMTNDFKIQNVRIVMFDKKKAADALTTTAKFAPAVVDDLLYYFFQEGIVVAQELTFWQEETEDKKRKETLAGLKKELERMQIAICLPIFSGVNIVGLIALGQKASASVYTKQDINSLLLFSNQASIVIANAILYQEVRDYSQNLKTKVSEQTKDICKKNEHLKKLLAMRGEFLNITSHQLRTPVSVIKGVLSMLKEDKLSKSEKASLLNTAYSKAIKLTDIVNDILMASEMKSDKFEVNLERVQLNGIINEVYADKQEEAKSKGIELILALPARPIADVLSNEKYIKQVLYNLVNNALQYTLKGSIAIKVEEKKEIIYLRVIDTGIGIPQESLPKLFQRFSRAPNAVATFTDGSGLGLFIIKEIIDAHRGAKVYVEQTELGKGTTFTVELPKAKAII